MLITPWDSSPWTHSFSHPALCELAPIGLVRIAAFSRLENCRPRLLIEDRMQGPKSARSGPAGDQSYYLPISALVSCSFGSVGVPDIWAFAAESFLSFLATRLLHFSSQ